MNLVLYAWQFKYHRGTIILNFFRGSYTT